MTAWNWDPRRRAHPRVEVEGFCLEVDDQKERPVEVIDLSPQGLRIKRPAAGWRADTVQLEFEIPGIDEVMWAAGHLRKNDAFYTFGAGRVVMRESGIELLAQTTRHQRMLEEYVVESWRAERAPIEYDWMDRAGCYMRG